MDRSTFRSFGRRLGPVLSLAAALSCGGFGIRTSSTLAAEPSPRRPGAIAVNGKPASEPAMLGSRVKEIEAEAMRLEGELVRIRDDYDPHQGPVEENHRAAGLLLKFSPPAAMPHLVEYLDWTHNANFKFDFGPYEEHPNARALWSQGSVAIPVMLRHLRLAPAERVSNRKIELIAFQMLVVHGDDDAGRARAVLAVATTDAHELVGSDGADNLRRLTARLKSLPKWTPGR